MIEITCKVALICKIISFSFGTVGQSEKRAIQIFIIARYWRYIIARHKINKKSFLKYDLSTFPEIYVVT